MKSQLYNNVKTAILLGLLSAVILVAGLIIGGRQGLIVALIVAVVMNFASYFFSDKIALASMRAEEVGPETELYQIVQELSGRDGLPMPRVYIAPTAAPNAFATGRNPHHAAVCATAGILQMLTREEMAGVIGHELSHVKHRDILIQSVAATIAAAISVLGYMFMWGGNDREDNGPFGMIAGLLVIILGPIAAALIQSAISRSREFNADKGGAQLTGDPMALATALEKIEAAVRGIPMNVNPAFNAMFISEPRNRLAGIANMFQTHPPLEERVMNLIGRPTTGRVMG